MSETIDEAIAKIRTVLLAAIDRSDGARLDHAVDLAGQVTRHPGFGDLHPSQAAVVWSLGGAARIYRSRIIGRPQDLDEAIQWCRRALEVAPQDDGNRPAYASNLATLLTERYDRDHNRSNLEEALGLFATAVPALRAAGADATTALHNQGLALLDLYQAGHRLADLDQALACFRDACADPATSDAEHGGYLNSLGQALRAKASAVSDPRLLEEAIQVLRQARAATDGSIDHVAVLVSLGNSLLDRYELTHATDDLTEAVACFEESLEHVAADAKRAAPIQSNLANALLAMFRETGDPATLRRAHELFQTAVESFAPAAPERPASINNLAACLLELYDQTGQLSFLDDAIERYQMIVDVAERPPSDPERHHNFGIASLSRYRRTAASEDLDRAIQLLRNAVRAFPPGSTGQAAAANSLGNALFLRYDRSQDLADLEAAIATHRHAAQIAPAGSVDRAMYQANLGVGLLARGQRRGARADIEAAIAEQEAAAGRVSERSPEFVRLCAALAGSLAERAALTGDAAAEEQARAAYRKAVSSGLLRLPEQALGSADEWGRWATRRRAFAEAAQAFGAGLQAMDQLFRTQLTRGHKETWLRNAQGLPARAAYARAKAADLAGAVEALEGGRAMLVSEALERDRADLEGLVAAGRSELKDRYVAAAGVWSRLSSQADPDAPRATVTPAREAEALAEELERARTELDAAIADIRTVPGYERFLQPPSFTDVAEVSRGDTLVYLAVTDQGGVALIMRPGGSVQTVWLEQLTEAALEEQVVAYRDAYRRYRARVPRSDHDRAAWWQTLDRVTAWLWKALMGQVLQVLGDVPHSRVTLIPAGLLGVLPLHAAWTPDRTRPTGRRYGLDELILGYAPNARSLAAARRLAQQVQSEQLLAVDEPALGGPAVSLPYSSAEVAAALATFPDHQLLAGRQATQRRVLQALSTAAVFHLSCHGHADFAQPLRSALLMARNQPPDGADPLTLGEILRERLRARLGVLSACETGIPGDELPDEVVSLPTGLLQAGAAGVIGSLWSVPERATALLMFQFYRAWRIDRQAPAQALRQAQAWVRDTTNAQMAEELGRIARDPAHPMAAAAGLLWRELLAVADLQAREHAHPYHWAAFTHIGA